MCIKTDIYLPARILPELTLSNMLTNVTKDLKITQLFMFTCFIIHVGLDRIGANAYA